MHKRIQNGREVALITSETRNRRNALHNFLNNQTKIVITTNLFERAIDNPNVSLVINYTTPMKNEVPDSKVYKYRAGRAGRFGKPGKVLTFVDRNLAEDVERCLRFELGLRVIEI